MAGKRVVSFLDCELVAVAMVGKGVTLVVVSSQGEKAGTVLLARD